MKKYAIFMVLSVALCFCLSMPSLAAGRILFSDDFKSMDNWQIGFGDFEAKDGVAECVQGIAFTGSKDWSDYSYEVTTRSLGSDDPNKTWLKAYIYFRVQDAANFYRFGIHGDMNSVELIKCENNQWTAILINSFIPVKNKWYKFKVDLTGERIKCYVDDKLVIDVKDSTFLQGNVGIGAADDKMSSSYKDVKVTEIDPKSYSPLEISITQYQVIKKEIVVNASILKTTKLPKFTDPKIKADLVDKDGKIVKTNVVSGFDAGGKASVPLSIVGIAPGDYTVNMSVAEKGKIILSSKQTVKVLDLPWIGSKAGVTDEVLPPWTPLVVNNLKISSWGRVYDFSKSFLPCAIETAGKSILSSPILFNLNVDGNDVALSGIKPTLLKKSDTKITLKADTATQNVGISANVTVEYDGMMRVDLTFDPKSEATINNMVLEIPIKKEFAKLYYWYGVLNGDPKISGALSDFGFRIPFRPYVWLGTEDLGMSWFADSNKYWSNKRPKSVINVVQGEDENFCIIRITFVDKPFNINKPITYTFGMQATPVKQFDNNWRKWHFIHHAYFGIEKEPAPGRPSPLEKLKKQGVNTIVFHENWTDIQNYPKTTHEAELKSLVDACHKLGMKIIVYFGYEISSIAPEFEGCKEEVWGSEPGKPFGGWFYTRLPEQNDYRVCYQSPWIDFIADGIAYAVDKYDLDGVYLDSTVMPPYCKNYLHGCGYFNDSGELCATCPVFATRDLMKRIYTICAKRGKFVNAHNFTCDITPILGFSTSYWDCEAYQEMLGTAKNESEFLRIIPLEMFRAQYIGKNFGVPAELLVYPKGKWNFEAGLAMALLHDVPVRPFATNSGKIFKVWKVWDDFGVGDTNCVFLPYWKNQDYVKVAPEGSYVSIYSKPGNSALIVISNLTNEGQDVNVTLNLKKLGLKNPKVSDAFTGEDIELQKNNDILISINKFKYKLLIVK